MSRCNTHTHTKQQTIEATRKATYHFKHAIATIGIEIIVETHYCQEMETIFLLDYIVATMRKEVSFGAY
jgi:hypothetical protein